MFRNVVVQFNFILPAIIEVLFFDFRNYLYKHFLTTGPWNDGDRRKHFIGSRVFFKFSDRRTEKADLDYELDKYTDSA